MFCILRYRGVCNEDGTELWSKRSTTSSKTTESGVNKTLLFNPDCYARILLDHLCDETGFERSREFVLCDETGSIFDLKAQEPWTYANNFLKPFAVYYMVACEKDGRGYTRLEPFLNRKSKEYVDLLGKLKVYVNSGKSSGRLKIRRSSEETFRRRRRSGSNRSNCSGSFSARENKVKKKLGVKSLRNMSKAKG